MLPYMDWEGRGLGGSCSYEDAARELRHNQKIASHVNRATNREKNILQVKVHHVYELLLQSQQPQAVQSAALYRCTFLRFRFRLNPIKITSS